MVTKLLTIMSSTIADSFFEEQYRTVKKDENQLEIQYCYLK